MRKILLAILFLVMCCCSVMAQTKATVRLDAQVTHQRITGFGGFVCSPQFQYNHMSTAEIKKVWGPTSTVGCNIMRLYIPIGRNAWGQSLATAKQARQLGLILFASPWGQPAEWKTNGSSDAKTDDGVVGSLKKENWPDYAQYLEDYVQYLRQNGVELDAISIQNEPDWTPTYAGCKWTTSEMAEFVKTYGRQISCKIITPESIGCSDGYVNALNKSDVLDCFDIYGGHQYAGLGSAYKNLAKKGKELWMTEYLINWNEGKSDSEKRNYDFSKDFFNFFTAINTCMLGDFNAWIHYAAKRYYAMMGDGTTGAGSSGVITKRGYIMAHFARFVTGMTRIDANWSGNSLESSAYLSQSGDTAVVVISNPGEAVTLTVDLPFYTETGVLYTTNKSKNFAKTLLTQETETCRPVAEVAAQSVCTVLFVRSRDRQPSNMQGTATRFDRLDDMTTTKTTFGTAYKLSGKTKTFDSSNPLISSRTNANYGYLALDERYSQLVMHINKVTTTSSLTAGATTLTYVNRKNEVVKHDYGRMDLSRGSNFDLVFDLSPATLPDGCIGLISLTCDNAVSKLTITFGDVYLGGDYAASLTGTYVADDSYFLDYSSDPSCTSLDMSACEGCPSTYPWLEGTNRVVWLPEVSSVGGANLVHNDLCHRLELFTDGGDFRPVRSFTADVATLTTTIDGCRMLMLPFEAAVPEGVEASLIADDMTQTAITSIPAHTPVIVKGNGKVTFSGTGEVSFARSPIDQWLRGTYTALSLYAGDYVLACHDGQWGFERLDEVAVLQPFDVYASLSSQEAFVPFDSMSGIGEVKSEELRVKNGGEAAAVYDLTGRRVSQPVKGFYIKDGKKIMIK